MPHAERSTNFSGLRVVRNCFRSVEVSSLTVQPGKFAYLLRTSKVSAFRTAKLSGFHLVTFAQLPGGRRVSNVSRQGDACLLKSLSRKKGRLTVRLLSRLFGKGIVFSNGLLLQQRSRIKC